MRWSRRSKGSGSLSGGSRAPHTRAPPSSSRASRPQPQAPVLVGGRGVDRRRARRLLHRRARRRARRCRRARVLGSAAAHPDAQPHDRRRRARRVLAHRRSLGHRRRNGHALCGLGRSRRAHPDDPRHDGRRPLTALRRRVVPASAHRPRRLDPLDCLGATAPHTPRSQGCGAAYEAMGVDDAPVPACTGRTADTCWPSRSSVACGAHRHQRRGGSPCSFAWPAHPSA